MLNCDLGAVDYRKDVVMSDERFAEIAFEFFEFLRDKITGGDVVVYGKSSSFLSPFSFASLCRVLYR